MYNPIDENDQENIKTNKEKPKCYTKAWRAQQIKMVAHNEG